MVVCFVCLKVDASLSHDDFGRDLASVQNLMKKHQLVEADITAHEVSSTLTMCIIL